MTSNREVMERYTRALNDHDFDAMFSLLHVDYVLRWPRAQSWSVFPAALPPQRSGTSWVRTTDSWPAPPGTSSTSSAAARRS